MNEAAMKNAAPQLYKKISTFFVFLCHGIRKNTQ